MPNLVGIGNSQVPTNGMLGGLAYQNSSVLDQVRSGRKNMIINGIGNFREGLQYFAKRRNQQVLIG